MTAETTLPDNTMESSPQRFRVGDRVQVASAEVVLSTLDANCRFEGLPFMPQMVPFCGQELTVTRWVNNVCYPVQSGADYGNLTSSVLLNVNRCDGVSFGGCQMACPLIWKTKWLSPIAGSTKANSCTNATEAMKQLKNLASANAMNSGLASCQATQLHQITHKRNRLDVGQYVDEVNLESRLRDSAGNFFLRRTAGANHWLKPIRCRHAKTNTCIRIAAGCR